MLDFLVDLFNHTVEGLDDVELWIHTCWGNPGAQHCFDPQISYEPSVDIYLNRLKGDVWTIESKENGHSLLPAFAPYKGNLPKKVAVGMISHRRLQVETPEDVAADIRTALEYIDEDKLVLSSDCGFGRQGVPRPIATYKAAALAQGANIVRGELGAEQTHVRAADPELQVDVPAGGDRHGVSAGSSRNTRGALRGLSAFRDDVRRCCRPAQRAVVLFGEAEQERVQVGALLLAERREELVLDLCVRASAGGRAPWCPPAVRLTRCRRRSFGSRRRSTRPCSSSSSSSPTSWPRS